MPFSPDITPPNELSTDEFVLRPITADDAQRDFDAVMETREHLRLWEQSEWPADDFTVEANRDDLADLEQRHNDNRAYTYTVLDPAGIDEVGDTSASECLGCVYIFPTDATFLAKATVTPVDDDADWSRVDAVVYFWARQSRMDAGMDARLLTALRGWFADDWGFDTTVYVTNEEFAQQVGLIGATDLALRFSLREPGKRGAYLVYG